MADEEPMAVGRIGLPAHLVPDLAATDMESGNLYRLLCECFDVVVCDVVQSSEPIATHPG